MSSEAEEMRRKLLREGSLIFDVKVIPRSQSAKVEALMANGRLKVKVRAAPEAGKANDEVCAVLAEYVAVPKGNVEVILGRTSQQKRIKIVRVTDDSAAGAAGLSNRDPTRSAGSRGSGR